eukprot:UN02501
MNVTICSPVKTICEDSQATLVTIPGNAGAFGISPGHIPVVCELQPGNSFCLLRTNYDRRETKPLFCIRRVCHSSS